MCGPSFARCFECVRVCAWIFCTRGLKKACVHCSARTDHGSCQQNDRCGSRIENSTHYCDCSSSCMDNTDCCWDRPSFCNGATFSAGLSLFLSLFSLPISLPSLSLCHVPLSRPQTPIFANGSNHPFITTQRPVHIAFVKTVANYIQFVVIVGK